MCNTPFPKVLFHFTDTQKNGFLRVQLPVLRLAGVFKEICEFHFFAL